MNCDDAFERMTEIGTARDAALEQHLSECRRCRAMQETLSPALEWLSSAQVQPENGRSPRAHGAVFLTDEALQVAERAAQRLHATTPAPRRSVRARNPLARWLALACMGVIGLFAVITPSSSRPTNSSSQTGVGQFQAAECLWQKPAEPAGGRPPIADQVIASCVACHITMR